MNALQWIRFSIVAMAVLAAAGCKKPSPPVWRVGLIGVFEGNTRNSSGHPGRLGARMAVDELNEAGGVNIGGVMHRVVLLDRETANRPDAAAAAARALINLDSADVVVGPQFSALALAAGVVAEASEVPLVAPMASSPQVTAGHRYVSRLAFLDATQGEVLSRFAYDSLGIRRTAALYNAASSYGREIVELYRSTFIARGGEMGTVETYNVDDPGPPLAQLRRLLASRPDAILLPNFSIRDSTQVRLLRAQGFNGQLLGSDGWDAITLRGRDYVRNTIIVANWDAGSGREGVTRFRTRFAAKYPDDRPRATAAATYDAILLLARAAQRSAARTGLALAEAFRRGDAYDGAFAAYRFDGTGNPVRGATLLQMVADSALYRATIQPPMP